MVKPCERPHVIIWHVMCLLQPSPGDVCQHRLPKGPQDPGYDPCSRLIRVRLVILNGARFGNIYLAGEALMPYWDHKVDGDRVLVWVGENCIIFGGPRGHMFQCPEVILAEVCSGLASANFSQFFHPFGGSDQSAFNTRINPTIEH